MDDRFPLIDQGVQGMHFSSFHRPYGAHLHGWRDFCPDRATIRGGSDTVPQWPHPLTYATARIKIGPIAVQVGRPVHPGQLL